MTMHYASGEDVRPGDRVEFEDGMTGEVRMVVELGPEVDLTLQASDCFFVLRDDGTYAQYQSSDPRVRFLAREKRMTSSTMEATIKKAQFLQLLEKLGSHSLYYPEPLSIQLSECGLSATVSADGQGIFIEGQLIAVSTPEWGEPGVSPLNVLSTVYELATGEKPCSVMTGRGFWFRDVMGRLSTHWGMAHETPIPNPVTVPDYIDQGYEIVPGVSEYRTRLTKTNDDNTVHTVDVDSNGAVRGDTTILGNYTVDGAPVSVRRDDVQERLELITEDGDATELSDDVYRKYIDKVPLLDILRADDPGKTIEPVVRTEAVAPARSTAPPPPGPAAPPLTVKQSNGYRKLLLGVALTAVGIGSLIWWNRKTAEADRVAVNGGDKMCRMAA